MLSLDHVGKIQPQIINICYLGLSDDHVQIAKVWNYDIHVYVQYSCWKVALVGTYMFDIFWTQHLTFGTHSLCTLPEICVPQACYCKM